MTPQAEKKLFLAPWRAMLNTPGYHGNLSTQEIEDILKDKPKGSYIISNYNPTGPDSEFNKMFYITIRWTVKNELKTLWTRGFTTHIEGFTKEYPDQHFLRKRHPMQCFYGKQPTQLIAKKTTFTLKQWCRATVCETYNHEQIKHLEIKKHIPKEISKYITEHSSTNPPTSRTHLLCKQDDWCEWVYPNALMEEDEDITIRNHNKVIWNYEQRPLLHAMMIYDQSTDEEGYEE